MPYALKLSPQLKKDVLIQCAATNGLEDYEDLIKNDLLILLKNYLVKNKYVTKDHVFFPVFAVLFEGNTYIQPVKITPTAEYLTINPANFISFKKNIADGKATLVTPDNYLTVIPDKGYQNFIAQRFDDKMIGLDPIVEGFNETIPDDPQPDPGPRRINTVKTNIDIAKYNNSGTADADSWFSESAFILSLSDDQLPEKTKIAKLLSAITDDFLRFHLARDIEQSGEYTLANFRTLLTNYTKKSSIVYLH